MVPGVTIMQIRNIYRDFEPRVTALLRCSADNGGTICHKKAKIFALFYLKLLIFHKYFKHFVLAATGVAFRLHSSFQMQRVLLIANAVSSFSVFCGELLLVVLSFIMRHLAPTMSLYMSWR